ncbi:hypothetical protein TSUD_36160 [Trifolium subterraneum]|uniref:Uncharacterized protein n=1 Tax=Trifolium subterraneum TaxID=3900 RepID=A0A2Z6NHD0_TRISU|nr:hypothetical protein TSUD_36160 [Trifolium subterraneum]
MPGIQKELLYSVTVARVFPMRCHKFVSGEYTGTNHEFVRAGHCHGSSMGLVYEPMEELDLDHNNNHRRAPHWHQCVPWQICQLDDLQQPESPMAVVQESNHCDNS